MPRPISTAFRNALESTEGEQIPVILAAVSHADFATKYLCSDNCDYIYGGNRYIASGCKIELLTDEDRPPRAGFAIVNVDQVASVALLPLSDTPLVSLTLVSSADFAAFDPGTSARSPTGTPTVHYSAADLRLSRVSGDAMLVTGELFSYDYATEPWGIRATKARLPGLFRDR